MSLAPSIRLSQKEKEGQYAHDKKVGVWTLWYENSQKKEEGQYADGKRAVSGHATEAMQQRYSTVAAEEMREGIGKVISLAKMKEAMAVTSHGGVQGGVHDAENKKAS
jgi:hypothetical protein